MNNIKFKTITEAPQYKADIAADEGVPMPSADTFDQSDEAQMEADIFGLPASDSAPPPDPLSLTIGHTAGTTVDPLTGEMVDAPSPYYVPTPEEIENKKTPEGTTIALSLSNWDKIEEIYNKKLGDCTKLRDDYMEQLESGLLTPAEAENVKWLLKCLDEAIAKIKESLNLLPIRRKELKKLYLQEQEDLQIYAKTIAEEYNSEDTDATRKSEIVATVLANADINKDGWIGEPEAKGSLQINEDKKKGWIIYDPDQKKMVTKFDPTTGTPVSKYWFAPGKEQKLMNGNIDFASEKIGNEDKTIEASPFGTGSAVLGTDIEIAVPDFITVKIDKETGKPKTTDVDTYDTRFIPADFEVVDGQLVQKALKDTDGYAQVRITKVEISSDDESGEDGVYDHIVKFYTADNEVAAVFRIKDGSDQVIAVTGTDRTEPGIIDASKMISTVQASLDETELEAKYSQYDVKNEDTWNEAFQENMGVFTGIGGHIDLDPELKTAPIVTGIVAVDWGGKFIGADNANNLGFFKDVALTQDEFKGTEANPMFANIFEGDTQTRNNIFAHGGGDLYATNVTLVHSENKTSSGITSIVVNEQINGADAETSIENSTKVYVHAVGGENDGIMIDNKADGQATNVKGADKDWNKDGSNNENDDLNGGGDDYYYTGGQGSYTIANTGLAGATDPDADSGTAAGADAFLNGQIGNDFEDALNDPDTETDDSLDLEETPDWAKGEYYSKSSVFLEGFFTEFEDTFSIVTSGDEDDSE